jgi:hypothetical protein
MGPDILKACIAFILKGEVDEKECQEQVTQRGYKGKG